MSTIFVSVTYHSRDGPRNKSRVAVGFFAQTTFVQEVDGCLEAHFLKLLYPANYYKMAFCITAEYMHCQEAAYHVTPGYVWFILDVMSG